MVEQAAIGYSLAVAPHELWEPLEERTRTQLIEWLALVNRVEPFDNNWQFFRILVNLGLRRVGAPVDDAAADRSLEKIHGLYLGDGWYRDGGLDGRDLYAPCAFHYYGLLYASLVDDEHAGLFRDRARTFASEWAAWFDDEGDVVPFGRSLTYRFVAGAFWSALAVADVEAMPWGQVRGLLGRHLRAWSARDIWRDDGTLTVGYGYENATVGEEYISAGSPYWAMKSFVATSVPETHGFWSEPEAPSPATDDVVTQDAPGTVLMRTHGHTVALSARHSAGGFRQGAARYAKFAYSSRYGFSFAGDHNLPHEVAPDSMLALSEGHGPIRVRRSVVAWDRVGEDLLTAEWHPWPDVRIVTVLWAQPPWHLRVHAIDTGRSLTSTEGGFAVGFGGSGALGPEPTRTIDAHAATVRTATDVSVVRDPSNARAGMVIAPLPDTNVFEPRTLLPVLTGTLDPGQHRLIGWFAAGPVGDHAETLTGPAPEISDRVIAALSF